MSSPARGVLFDVDGTLVDTNYLHTVAWWHAFGAHGHQVPMTRLHRLIGQGSARLVTNVLGHDDADVTAAHTDFYGPFLYQLRAFPAAADVLRATKRAGLAVVLATSASSKEAAHLRAAIGCDDVIDAVTTKDDVAESKPDPDIVQAALAAAGLDAGAAVFVGDTVWDVEAAASAGVECVAVLTGGISASELRDAGAVAVYDDLDALLADFDASPIGRLAEVSGAGSDHRAGTG
jgi:HAD superfamily hydrolase (TIGR01509 family)